LTGWIASALHGIPILVKDNIAANDGGLEASAGSFALLGSRPVHESSVIERLRQVGMVILGKTNMSEWAGLRGFKISSGGVLEEGRLWASIIPILRLPSSS